jgi:hypothetical protein
MWPYWMTPHTAGRGGSRRMSRRPAAAALDPTRATAIAMEPASAIQRARDLGRPWRRASGGAARGGQGGPRAFEGTSTGRRPPLGSKGKPSRRTSRPAKPPSPPAKTAKAVHRPTGGTAKRLQERRDSVTKHPRARAPSPGTPRLGPTRLAGTGKRCRAAVPATRLAHHRRVDQGTDQVAPAALGSRPARPKELGPRTAAPRRSV